jgi:hypothetical protein
MRKVLMITPSRERLARDDADGVEAADDLAGQGNRPKLKRRRLLIAAAGLVSVAAIVAVAVTVRANRRQASPVRSPGGGIDWQLSLLSHNSVEFKPRLVLGWPGGRSFRHRA